MALMNLFEDCVQTMPKKSNKKIKARNWKEYEEDSMLLYSYLKKKGKHQRAKEDPKNR